VELSLEYIAGFFDGEGSIGLYPERCKRKYGIYRHYRFSVSLGNSDPIVPLYLKARFGGSVHHYERSKKMKNRQDAWLWNMSSKRAAEFLRAILPFLVVKKAQAEVVLEYYAQRPRPGHKYVDRQFRGMEDAGAEYVEKLKLMKRGDPRFSSREFEIN
jgi:LAGLIDADG DNA endonuclease family protein